jgi:uncharacterized protein (UPF0332 family)
MRRKKAFYYEQKSEAIKIQLDRAKELLDEIPIHISHNFFNTALNRLYYSCFYGARALALSIDLVPKTHTGILKIIHLHFVKENILDESFSKLLARLYNFGQKQTMMDHLPLQKSRWSLFLKKERNLFAL